MARNVISIAHRCDARRVLDAAEQIRHADCVDAADFADLLVAIGTAGMSFGRPALGECESWRWNAAWMRAVKIADGWGVR